MITLIKRTVTKNNLLDLSLLKTIQLYSVFGLKTFKGFNTLNDHNAFRGYTYRRTYMPLYLTSSK